MRTAVADLTISDLKSLADIDEWGHRVLVRQALLVAAPQQPQMGFGAPAAAAPAVGGFGFGAPPEPSAPGLGVPAPCPRPPPGGTSSAGDDERNDAIHFLLRLRDEALASNGVNPPNDVEHGYGALEAKLPDVARAAGMDMASLKRTEFYRAVAATAWEEAQCQGWRGPAPRNTHLRARDFTRMHA